MENDTPKNSPYFRSIDEWAQSSDFQKDWLQREFTPGASESEGVSRREFLKMMAGGIALMGLTGCRRPESHIVPFSEQPEKRIPGVPMYFASAQPRAAEGIPLIVESHEGRPTKIEGNARYLPFKGATDVSAQAYVMELYNPDRATRHYQAGKPIDRAAALTAITNTATHLAATAGEGTVVLAAPTVSPALLSAKATFLQKYPRAQWIDSSAFPQNNFSAATQASLGVLLRPHWRFDKADAILAIDADFVGREVGSIAYAKAFTARRRPARAEEAATMPRLYAAEPELTLTGAQADHRLRLSSDELVPFAARLLATIEHLTHRVSALHSTLQAFPLTSEQEKWLAPMSVDLVAHGHRALVLTGSHSTPALQLLVLAINDRLASHAVEYFQLPATSSAPLSALKDAQHLILFDVNPAYQLPASLNWARTALHAKSLLRWGYTFDETSLLAPSATQVLAAHPLESWGDTRTFDGTLLPIQPLIEPLFDGIEPLEFWARLTGSSDAPHALAQRSFANVSGQSSTAAYEKFLNNGLLPESGYPVVKNISTVACEAALAKLLAATPKPSEALELITRPSYSVGTGDNANCAWLQECPDPITKLTWGNALYVSPALAVKLGYNPAADTWLPIASRKLASLDHGKAMAPLAHLTVGSQTITVPLAIQPGLADRTVLLNLGYGRTKAGRNADKVGVNAFALLASNDSFTLADVSVKLTSDTVLMATTQNHWSIEGRDIYREGAAEDFIANPAFAQRQGVEGHSPAPLGAAAALSLQERTAQSPRGNSAYDHPKYEAPQQWGMSIDLSACTGCNACVIACQSENNIATVGREQVLRGREMHWIRIDRYYASGDLNAAHNGTLPANVDVALQPMLCQHCERAPCEQVCPVNATVHDDQGLNVMAYNRCVGTRYCANNCPYKVRRFNFFEYAKRDTKNLYWGMFGPEGMPELLKLQKNPDVTVRSRGVMEKCTFCQQRIEQAKIRQRVLAKDSANIMVADGVIKTACQQVCPTEAIVFGDILDPNSAVSRAKASPRDYSVLGYLNTRPRLTYLARIRNPNPQMPDFIRHTRFRLEADTANPHGDHTPHGAHDEHATEPAHTHE